MKLLDRTVPRGDRREWWTLLIVRDAFFGVTRLEVFKDRLGIARNILSKRLDTLVEHGVLDGAATTRRATVTTTS
jgi:hypothetical protein